MMNLIRESEARAEISANNADNDDNRTARELELSELNKCNQEIVRSGPDSTTSNLSTSD